MTSGHVPRSAAWSRIHVILHLVCAVSRRCRVGKRGECHNLSPLTGFRTVPEGNRSFLTHRRVTTGGRSTCFLHLLERLRRNSACILSVGGNSLPGCRIQGGQGNGRAVGLRQAGDGVPSGWRYLRLLQSLTFSLPVPGGQRRYSNDGSICTHSSRAGCTGALLRLLSC